MTKMTWFTVAIAVALFPIIAQEPTWTKKLKDRKKITQLQDASQYVRGDRGRWSDKAKLFLGSKRPPKTPLDLWLDVLEKKKPTFAKGDDVWLILRTKQLDDNDRVWIEEIKRDGAKFSVVANRANWKGKYFRNFTYYAAIGVNLGKLQPGRYEATWTLRPMQFTKFDGDGKPRGNWPKEERAADGKPTVVRTTWTVGE